MMLLPPRGSEDDAVQMPIYLQSLESYLEMQMSVLKGDEERTELGHSCRGVEGVVVCGAQGYGDLFYPLIPCRTPLPLSPHSRNQPLTGHREIQF